MIRNLRWPLFLLLALVLAPAVVGSVLPELSAAPIVQRTVYMAAVEPKGGASVDKEPFPMIALPPGAGYVLKAPDAGGRWEVSVYQWQPSFVVVNQGERVTLEIIGINGAEHPSSVEAYLASFVVRRGQVTSVSFNAHRPGMFAIRCQTHQPSMTGYLLVLPRR